MYFSKIEKSQNVEIEQKLTDIDPRAPLISYCIEKIVHCYLIVYAYDHVLKIKHFYRNSYHSKLDAP